jgi:hypothetical protein
VTEGATLLAQWETFYLIVGSSAAALTGLQFVVIALVAEAQRKGSSDTVNTFGTPTVVHFCIVLVTAAVISAPWEGVFVPSVALAVCGIGGVVYAGIVTLRARRQSEYTPVLEDWIWHSILPLAAYTLLLVGAIMSSGASRAGLFAIGGATLLLLLIGIHNAWDSVEYIATERYGPPPSAGD